MELLNNAAIKEQLSHRSFFDLCSNNSRLNIIIPLEENAIDKLKEIFNKIVSNDKMDDGYYLLQNLFVHAQMVDPNIVINLIIDSIKSKINIIRETIFNENGKLDYINIGMYIQVWKSYKDFSQKIYVLIKNYQQYLVERNIKTGKISHDILSIIQICMFYDGIINKENNDKILSLVSKDLNEIDKKNIEQLIDYIDSIRAFMIMKEFTFVDREKLSVIIKNIMNCTNIVNIMCAHMHNLLKSLTNKQMVIDDTEYETIIAGDTEKKLIKKIYKMATILSTYAEKTKLLACYSKFMQIRIIDLKYDNLELEIEIIRRISGALGKEDAQKLIDAIADIINTKNANQVIQVAEIKVKSDEYKKIENITSKVLCPIILTKNIWKIYNTSDMEPIYPLEMKCYLDIITKSYLNIYQGQYIIDWQPTMGSAQFEAQIGSKKIDITCNILQAMALMYLNDNLQTTASKFATDSFINLELATKIFESLFEANLVIYLSIDKKDDPMYIVNKQNYTGENKIDIRRIFVETFEVEEEKATIKKQTNVCNDKKNGKNKKDENSSYPLMSYLSFVSTTVKNLEKTKPGLKNSEYMKMAASKWVDYKKQTQKNAPNKLVDSKGSDYDSNWPTGIDKDTTDEKIVDGGSGDCLSASDKDTDDEKMVAKNNSDDYPSDSNSDSEDEKPATARDNQKKLDVLKKEKIDEDDDFSEQDEEPEKGPVTKKNMDILAKIKNDQEEEEESDSD
jgi:hypothetical protein